MIDLKAAQQLDQQDPLHSFRSCFFHEENEIYLDGNSLGKLPKKVPDQMAENISTQWGKQLIRSWNQNWLTLPKRLSKKYSQLLAANPDELIFGESTSVRLYQILHALLSSHQYPPHLISDNLNFPTDLYVLEGLQKQFPDTAVTTINYGQEIEADLNKLLQAIEQQPGIVCLSLVTFKSAYFYPMKKINQWAAKHNSIVVWDLSHAVGAVPIDLEASETKIALGCTYKYLNGGPGSPAFLYVKKELHPKLDNPIQGWFGHENPFDFDPKYKASPGLERFNNGTPPILSMQAVEAGIDLVLQAGIENLRAKSIQQSEFLLGAIDEVLAPLGCSVHSPLDSKTRGSHIAISHSHAWQICQALLAGDQKTPRIIPDFRPPNFIRIGITPLYTRFEDLWLLVNRIQTIVNSKIYLQFDETKQDVT